MKTASKQNRNQILIYLAVTFGLTWAYCLGILYPVVRGTSLLGVPAVLTQLLVSVVMFFPALGVLLTRLITKEGFRDAWLRPNLKKNIRYYLLAWFAPGALSILGAGVYFLLFRDNFDPALGYLRQTLEAAGGADAIPVPLPLLMLVQGAQALLMGPILNFVPCFGEEWGWRGYLLPKLSRQLPMLPTLLLSGIIWGLWHAPLTIIGHNYGMNYPGYPFAGIAMMCLFCTVLGIFMSFVTLKTKSCFPAVLAHGAVNGIAAIGIYFTTDGGNPFVGPAPTGILGILPFLLLAIFLAANLIKESKKGTA